MDVVLPSLPPRPKRPHQDIVHSVDCAHRERGAWHGRTSGLTANLAALAAIRTSTSPDLENGRRLPTNELLTQSCELMIPFSVLDLSPIAMGSDAGRSLRNTLDLAQHAEAWGYRRYWLAEHHSMPRHRERRHLGGHRPRCRGNVAHPCRSRRDHVAQSFAAGDRRAIRHPRGPFPRTDRSRIGAGPRLRSNHGAGAQAHSRFEPRRLPAGRHRTAAVLCSGRGKPEGDGRAKASVSKSPSGFWARACSAPRSPRRSGYHSLLPRTSPLP